MKFPPPVTTALVFSLTMACASPPPPAPAPPPTAPATVPDPPPKPAADPLKIAAPVSLQLSSSSLWGQVTVTLVITPTAAVPDARARFVVPEGVSVLEGTSEIHLGALTANATVKHTISLQVPDQGRFQLAAGVDCVMSDALTLNASKVLVLGDGQAPKAESTVIKPSDRATGIRLTPAKAP